MKITYVCTDPGVPVFGTKGASIHVQEVIRALHTLGHDVTLVARRLGGEAPADLMGVRVVLLPVCPGGTPAARERWLLDANTATRDAVLDAGDCDFVYERHALWSHAPMETARALGVPGVLEVNAPLVQEQSAFRTLHDVTSASDAAFRSFGAATSIVAVSESVAQYIRSAEPACAPVHVVPNGVNTDRFHARVAPALPAPDLVTIGFIGSLKPWHGVEVLLDAFARLHTSHPHTRLLIVGDGPERAALERRASALNIAPHTRFTGAVDAARIPSLVTSMEITTAPYPQIQGCYFSPLKVFEYMACARAVVASRTGQVRDIIRDGVNGVLCEPGDATSLAHALASLVDSPDTRMRLGAAARSDAVASMTWLHVARTIVALSTRAGAVQGAS